jgi:hypothetical protein
MQIKLRRHVAAMVRSHHVSDYRRILTRGQFPQRHAEKKRHSERCKEKSHTEHGQNRLVFNEPGHVQTEKRGER